MVKGIKDRDVYAQYGRSKETPPKKPTFAHRWSALHVRANRSEGEEISRLYKEAMRLAKREEKTDRKEACERLKTFNETFKKKLPAKRERSVVVFLRSMTEAFNELTLNRKHQEKLDLPPPIAKMIQKVYQQEAKIWNDVFIRLFGKGDEQADLIVRHMQEKIKKNKL